MKLNKVMAVMVVSSALVFLVVVQWEPQLKRNLE
jgi:hypothetical protein